MTTVADLLAWLEDFAPTRLAEPWDNVGLLFGDPSAEVSRVMTCLTVTPRSADEAIDRGAQAIVSHHPVLFKPIKSLRADRPETGPLWRLAGAGVAILSPHTAFDNTIGGINDGLAGRIGLVEVEPLRPSTGSGRVGRLERPEPLGLFADRVARLLRAPTAQFVGDPARVVQRVALCCGAGDDFLPDADRVGADVLLTGEARFHRAIEADALGIGLVVVGHHATERPGVEDLADRIARAFPGLDAWASRLEVDPLRPAILNF